MPAGLAGEDRQGFLPFIFGSVINHCLPTQTGVVALHTSCVAQSNIFLRQQEKGDR